MVASLVWMIHLCATGSPAAVIHAGIGNVAAGSAFALMQSAGTAPLMLATIGATVGAAVVVNLKARERLQK